MAPRLDHTATAIEDGDGGEPDLDLHGTNTPALERRGVVGTHVCAIHLEAEGERGGVPRRLREGRERRDGDGGGRGEGDGGERGEVGDGELGVWVVGEEGGVEGGGEGGVGGGVGDAGEGEGGEGEGRDAGAEEEPDDEGGGAEEEEGGDDEAEEAAEADIQTPPMPYPRLNQADRQRGQNTCILLPPHDSTSQNLHLAPI
ncbi:hypothetical protein OsI_35188 [Oryza sativa Indica Group]|uniref:Uncharacterized protein n=1 Tax=Oryza sativa subsp. indica TaxID=39946 RepID=B8BJ74_ORYSI|nr:hypothetical protein OsI_35188 [Oryza sativa Indica Group]